MEIRDAGGSADGGDGRRQSGYLGQTRGIVEGR